MKLLKLPLRERGAGVLLLNVGHIVQVLPRYAANPGVQSATIYFSLDRNEVIETSATFDEVTMALVTLATDPNTMFIDLTKPTP